jgi:hypothetical protein
MIYRIIKLINEDVDITTQHTHRSFIRRHIFEIIIFISGGIQEMRCVRSSSCQLIDHRIVVKNTA